MIHLVTDSTAYLPPKFKAQFNVHTISLNVIVGAQTFPEEGGLTQEAFYELVDTVETAPSTSQPSSGQFIELYQSLLVDEDDEIISIHISDALSGTVANARIAARMVDENRIFVVDSRNAGNGEMIIVQAAALALAEGKSRIEILAMLDRLVNECETLFVVETLKYLHKGGRINTASRLLGTVLNIKPILYLVEGKIAPLDKARSFKRALARLLDELETRMQGRPVYASVAHVMAAEQATALTKLVQQRLNCQTEIYTCEMGPVIGTHVGPGVLGVSACPID